MPIPIIAAAGSFLFSPLGKYAVIGLAVLAAYTYVDRKATYRERERCQAAVIQSRLDAANADKLAAERAEEEAKRAAQELEGEKRNAEAENEALRKKIAALPLAEQCIIPDRSVRKPAASKPSR